MIDESRLRQVAERLVGVGGVVGVMLGGSRARGEHSPDSDVDLGIYYRPPLDMAELRALAREVAGADAVVTEPGEWGPWVDGGGWLTIDGTPVDWLYREVDRVQASWAGAQAGRHQFHVQVGHPLGVPAFWYAGEVALGVVLADPTGELTGLHAAAQQYPAKLRDALVAGLWEASFLLDIAAKAVSRADAVYVSGGLFHALLLCAHALHGHAGRWLINEKGAIRSAGQLPLAPVDFSSRAQLILGRTGLSPTELTAAISAAAELLAETRSACS